jgi:hypothetical protein
LGKIGGIGRSCYRTGGPCLWEGYIHVQTSLDGVVVKLDVMDYNKTAYPVFNTRCVRCHFDFVRYVLFAQVLFFSPRIFKLASILDDYPAGFRNLDCVPNLSPSGVQKILETIIPNRSRI